ncbi:LOW QUALITY PROTEIN: secreted protein, partial [Streptomyces sp. C]
MYPKVKPALARAWRDLQTVQFGVTPAHAVVLGPLDTATGSLIDRIDGTRGMELLRAEGAGMGLPEGQVDGLVRHLAGAGLLDDLTAGGPRAQALRRRPEVLERLGPDLGSLSLVHREPGGDLRGAAARRALRVQVRGSGRVGAVIAAVLAGAGVGRVDVLDGGRVEAADVAPGGLDPGSVGRPRAEAAGALVRTAAPGRAPGAGDPGGPGPEPALVVLAPRDGLQAWAPDPAVAADWVATGTPHLYAGVLEGTGLVGPWCCPGRLPARGAWSATASTGTRPGPGCWSSGARRTAGAGRGPATWGCPRRWPAWPRRTPWPSSTGSCPLRRPPGGRPPCPGCTGSPPRCARTRTAPARPPTRERPPARERRPGRLRRPGRSRIRRCGR